VLKTRIWAQRKELLHLSGVALQECPLASHAKVIGLLRMLRNI
jgi:hypothetical protein